MSSFLFTLGCLLFGDVMRLTGHNFCINNKKIVHDLTALAQNPIIIII